MGFGRYRFRRSFGNVSSQFRGARFDTYPLFTGILDDYPSAAAAYSLRALSAAWLAGDVVEVRRSSDSATQSFTANQITNGDLVAFCGVGDGFVSTWYDQSGNGKDAIQATTTSQPKIVDGGSLITDANGTPRLEFNGNFLEAPHVLSLDDLLSLYAVATFNNNLDRQRIVTDSFYNSAGDNGGFNIENKAFSTTRIAGTLSDSSTGSYSIGSPSDITAGTTQLFTLDLPASGTLGLYVDGTLADSVFSAKMNSEDGGSPLRIGGSSGGTVDIQGFIQEIIVYNSDQSANREAIETNINNQYDIY